MKLSIREFLNTLDGDGIIITGDDAELNLAIQQWDVTLDTEIDIPLGENAV